MELLNGLQKKRFRIAVATMRFTHRVVQAELKHLRVHDLIDVLLTREDLGLDRPLNSFEETVQQRVKLVTRALKELNTNIRNSFLVGDSWWDVRAGKSIGITTVLVRTGFSAYNDFSHEHPDFTVSSLKDLQDTLGKNHWNLSKIS
jgi:phosphoglycolate phosphatase-like HAD superfamily hydrolase